MAAIVITFLGAVIYTALRDSLREWTERYTEEKKIY